MSWKALLLLLLLLFVQHVLDMDATLSSCLPSNCCDLQLVLMFTDM